MMYKRVFFGFILVLPCFLLYSCSRTSASVRTSSTTITGAGPDIPGPACFVYKTRADYSRQVPLILSPDKSKILSFPDIHDLYYQGKFSYPDTLKDGYLLDNRGIGPDVAFLIYTYEEYSRLGKTPTAEELMQNLLEIDPLLELYQCGKKNQYADPVHSLNEMISLGRLKDCNRLK
jgi:hypothetical protein